LEFIVVVNLSRILTAYISDWKQKINYQGTSVKTTAYILDWKQKIPLSRSTNNLNGVYSWLEKIRRVVPDIS
tara:strand:- start:334 stop:549 length:216 start_codon:yes stop_codon:yes gene_type:complete